MKVENISEVITKALIIGDCHIGANLSYGKTLVGLEYNSKVADQADLLNWALDQAIEEECSHIILTGDVFEEPRPAYYLIKLLISFIKRAGLANIFIIIVRGNHDYERNGNIYYSPLDILEESEFDNVAIYNDFDTIFLGRTGITLMPFMDRKSLHVNSNKEAIEILKRYIDYELSSIPDTYKKIAIGHFAIEGSIFVGNEIDDISNELFISLDMLKEYDAVWMGHVHKYQILSKKPHISHIGSMDISNFGETDQKKFIIIYDCNSGAWEQRQLPTRQLKKIVLDLPKEQTNTTEFVLKELDRIKDFKGAIVKLDVNIFALEAKPLDKNKIEEFLYSKNVFNIIQISEAKQVQIIKKESAAGEEKPSVQTDLKSAIKNYANTYIEKDKISRFINLAISIYDKQKSEEK